VAPGSMLWRPSAATIEEAQLTRYRRWLSETHDLHLELDPFSLTPRV
jgi:hypothetical protein